MKLFDWFKKKAKPIVATTPTGQRIELPATQYPKSSYKVYFEKHLNYVDGKWNGTVNFHGYNGIPAHEKYLFTASNENELHDKMEALIKLQMEQYKR
jgi:hypothetical protein